MADFIPLSEAAEELGVAHSTLAVQARRGRIPGAKKIGPIWVAPRSGIDHYREHSLGKPGLRPGTKIVRA